MQVKTALRACVIVRSPAYFSRNCLPSADVPYPCTGVFHPLKFLYYRARRQEERGQLAPTIYLRFACRDVIDRLVSDWLQNWNLGHAVANSGLVWRSNGWAIVATAATQTSTLNMSSFPIMSQRQSGVVAVSIHTARRDATIPICCIGVNWA